MTDHTDLADLRRDPIEWRRRGLTPPAVLDAMVAARLVDSGVAQPEPSYADFFVAA